MDDLLNTLEQGARLGSSHVSYYSPLSEPHRPKRIPKVVLPSRRRAPELMRMARSVIKTECQSGNNGILRRAFSQSTVCFSAYNTVQYRFPISLQNEQGRAFLHHEYKRTAPI